MGERGPGQKREDSRECGTIYRENRDEVKEERRAEQRAGKRGEIK